MVYIKFRDVLKPVQRHEALKIETAITVTLFNLLVSAYGWDYMHGVRGLDVVDGAVVVTRADSTDRYEVVFDET